MVSIKGVLSQKELTEMVQFDSSAVINAFWRSLAVHCHTEWWGVVSLGMVTVNFNNWSFLRKPRKAIWYPNRQIKCLYQMYFKHIKTLSQEISCYSLWKLLFQLILKLNFNILEAWFYSNESHSIG